jgi:hypothetical protein
MSNRLFGAASLIAASLIPSSAVTLAARQPSIPAAAPQPQTQPFQHPLVFEPNRGQAPAQVQWIARAAGYQLFFTSEGVTMLLKDRSDQVPPSTLLPALFQAPASHASAAKPTYSTMKMKLTGGRPWQAVAGLEPTGGTSNYFIGNDPKAWHTGIPHYARLSAAGVYDGIDLVFYSHGGQLEYDFVVAPGADPKQIRLAFEGLDGTRIDGKTGDLVLATSGGGEMRHIRPRVYEQAGNRKVEVAAAYEILDRRQAAFTLASYDRGHELVIDPTVNFTTFLSGNDSDTATAIAVDSSGNSYVTGQTNSTNFPVIGGIQSDQPGLDAFVTKLSPTGAIVFSTYWGGTGSDGGSGIAVDSTGVFITGSTNSPNFPGLWSAPVNGHYHAFITKFSLGGNGIYSTIVGGSGDDVSNGIALDAGHAAYMTGYTHSPDFPTVGSWHTSYAGAVDGFVVKVVPGGSIGASAYLGGSADDVPWAIAVDHLGSAWITGSTTSPNYPHTGPITISPGSSNIFVTRLNSTFTGLYFSTVFQGDVATAIAVDANYNAFIAGNTMSSAAVGASAGVFQPVKPSPPNTYSAVVYKLDSFGDVMYSTFFSGTNGNTFADAIALNAAGDVYVAGWTSSTNFPDGPAITPNPTAGFVSKLTPQLIGLYFTQFLGAGIRGIALGGSSLYPPIYTTGYRFTGGLDSKNVDAFVVELIDPGAITRK